MCKSLLKSHPEVCLRSPPPVPVYVTVSKSMGRIVTDNGLPLVTYQHLKLNRKPGNFSSVDPVLRAYPGIEIQLAFILYVSQCWRFFWPSGWATVVSFRPP